MKGIFNVQVRGKNIVYNLVLRRNITIIRGDSGTGKTSLVNCIRDFTQEGKESGVKIDCRKKCTTIISKSDLWVDELLKIEDSIVFLDEDAKFMTSSRFAEIVMQSDNYYVLITREKLSMLPYSCKEVYELREAGRDVLPFTVYNEAYHEE